jgi:hypothetical protein
MGTYLSRTPGSAGNRKTMTFSCWVKRSGLGSFQSIISAGTNGATYSDDISFQSTDKLMLDLITTSGRYQAESTALFRDPSAWYHIVIAIDTTAASNRMLVYVNNEQVAVNSGGIPQNQDITFNNNTLQEIGRRGSNSSNFGDYYLAEFNFIDGQALTPTSFGLTDSTTGIWKPKVFSGSYGSNGYRLEFKNAGALGTDTSGNSNTWTVSNADTSNQVVDTPSNNFSTFNNLIERPTQGIADFSEGNCKVGGTSDMGFSSIALPSSGKWYAEFKATAGTSTAYVGLRDVDDYTADGNSNRLFYNSNGGKDTGSGDSAYGSTWTTGDIISMACDVDNSQVVFYKNGTAQDSGTAISQNCANQYFFVATAGGWSFQANFGNPSFSISSGNADANGYGNFEYAVPSGYYALCTENLNTYG